MARSDPYRSRRRLTIESAWTSKPSARSRPSLPPSSSIASLSASAAACSRAAEGCYGEAVALELEPISLRDANAFIAKHHRHHPGRRSCRFAVAVRRGRRMVGVAIAGNPVSKALNDGRTLEVSRSCTTGAKNANSMLYAACWRAARAIGYRRMITYTLPEESGSSLRAIGMRQDGMTEGRPWSRPKRPRPTLYTVGPKVRWIVELPEAA